MITNTMERKVFDSKYLKDLRETFDALHNSSTVFDPELLHRTRHLICKALADKVYFLNTNPVAVREISAVLSDLQNQVKSFKVEQFHIGFLPFLFKNNVLEERSVYDGYACIYDNLGGIEQAFQSLDIPLEWQPVTLLYQSQKLIKFFFEVMQDTVAKFKDKDLLNLCRKIIDYYSTINETVPKFYKNELNVQAFEGLTTEIGLHNYQLSLLTESFEYNKVATFTSNEIACKAWYYLIAANYDESHPLTKEYKALYKELAIVDIKEINALKEPALKFLK